MIHLGRGLYTSDMDFLFCYRGVQKNGRFTLKLAYLGHELQILLPRCVMDMTFTENVVYEIAVSAAAGAPGFVRFTLTSCFRCRGGTAKQRPMFFEHLVLP